MADIADIGFRVDTAALDQAKQKVDGLFNTIQNQTKSIDNVNQSVQGMAAKIDNSTNRQVLAYGKVRKAVEAQAAQAAQASQEQIAASRAIEAAVAAQSATMIKTTQAQNRQIKALLKELKAQADAARESKRATRELGDAADEASTGLRELQNRLMGIGNAVSIIDGPLGGIASRFSAFSTLVGRFGIQGALFVGAVSVMAGSVKALVTSYVEAENSIARFEAMVANTGGRMGTSGREISAQARDVAKATAQSYDEIAAASVKIMSMQNTTFANHARLLTLTANAAAATGKSMDEVAESLTDALEDPINRSTALSELFPQFTDLAVQAVSAMAQMKGPAAAQEMVLAELEKTYGGVSAAMTEFSKDVNSIGSSLSTFGRGIGYAIFELLHLEEIAAAVAEPLANLSSRVSVVIDTASAETQLKVLEEDIKQIQERQQKGFFGQGAGGMLQDAARAGKTLLLAPNAVLTGGDPLETQAERLERLEAIRGRILAQQQAEQAQARQAAMEQKVADIENLNVLTKQLETRRNMTAEERAVAKEREKYGFGDFKPGSAPDLAANAAVAANLRAQRDDEALTNAEDLIRATKEQVEANNLLAQSLGVYGKASSEVEALQTTILRLKAIDPSLPMIQELETQLQSLRESEKTLGAAEEAANTEAAYQKVKDAIVSATEAIKVKNDTAGLAPEVAAREELIQKAINDQRSAGVEITREQIEATSGPLLDAYQEAFRINEEINAAQQRRADNTKTLENLAKEKLELEAQQAAIQQIGFKTEDNTREFKALVDAHIMLNGLTEEEKAAMQGVLAEVVNSARAVDDMNSGLRESEAAARRVESALSGIANAARSAAASARENQIYMDLRAGGASKNEATARAEAEAKYFEVTSQITGGPTTENAEAYRRAREEAEAYYVVRLQDLNLSEQRSAMDRAETDALKETEKATKDAAKELENLKKATDSLFASLDPTVAAQQQLAEQTKTLNDAMAAGIITSEQYAYGIASVTREYEKATDPLAAYYDKLTELQDPEKFKLGGLEAAQDALAEFLFNPFEEGVEGMVRSFAQAMGKMAAQAISARIMQGIMGGLGWGVPGAAGAAGGAGAAAAQAQSAAALSSAGSVLTGSGQMLNTSAMSLQTAANSMMVAASASNAANMAGGLVNGVPALGQVANMGGGGGFLGSLLGGVLPSLGGLGSIFSGFFDVGGQIPANRVGIVGENGPELIAGPASVTSRRDTAAMLSQKAPEVNAKIINVLDPSIVGQYLTTEAGEKLVLNILSDNGVI